MSCYAPQRCWMSKSPASDGKYRLWWQGAPASAVQIELPCGYCIGCRLDRARTWAIRCVHEASLHDENCFVTLTYEVPPSGGTLVKKHMQDFWKRLRKAIHPKKLRYYMCGEYGETNGRPHYHACIFGWRPPDICRVGEYLYGSQMLTEIWGHGFVSLGDVTADSAAYVARYVIKKQYGETADYGGREPEYTAMSRNPGIGQKWIEKYLGDVYGFHDGILFGDQFVRAPRYYDAYLGAQDAEKLLMLKEQRIRDMINMPEEERQGMRLWVKQEVAKKRLALKKRSV